MITTHSNNRIKSRRNKKDPQRMTKIKPFIDKHNCEGGNYPSKDDDWNEFENNNLMIALMFCVIKKKTYILPMFQNNSNHEKQLILLLIPNGAGWNYLAVKKLSGLLIGIT